MRQPTDASIGALIDALVSGGAAVDMLRAWLAHAGPRADLALLAGAASPGPDVSLRRVADGWRVVDLPPVPLSEPPGSPEARSPAARRDDALDDLLLSLGMGQALVVPLGGLGTEQLVLARADGPFGTDEVAAVAARAGWLAPALRAAARSREDASRGHRAVHEHAAMTEIARELAPLVGPREAALSAAHGAQQQLAPVAGAVFVRAAPDAQPLAAAWPASEEGRALVLARLGADADGVDVIDGDRHAVSGRLPGTLRWIEQGTGAASGGFPRARLLLGFDGEVPAGAERVAARIAGALGEALERIAAQRAAVEQRLLVAFRELPLGVVLLAPASGRVRFMNDAALALLETIGAAPDDAQRLERIGGTPLAPLVDEALTAGSAYAEVLVPRTEQVIEARVYRASAGADDTPRDVQIVLEDVTEERRRAVTMARAERLSAMGVLVSGIVHEINNPLSTIRGYGQMLARDPDAAKRERWIALIDEEVRRCQRIVSDMLLLAREQRPRGETISLGALAERAIALLRHPFRAGGIEVTLRIADNAPDVEADPDAVTQVLINLLTNAMHALRERETGRRVEVRIDACGSGVRLAVADNGPGIPAELQARVFDPFFTTKPEGEGTGFGLSLVASTAERHGGDVELESVPGKGTTIALTLPAAAPGREPATAAAATAAKAPRALTLSGRRVLVAEDDAPVADVLREILEASGAAVTVATDGAEALALAVAERPDAILSDLNMPGLDGDGLLDALRRRDPPLAARLIFTTGERGESGRHRGRPRLVKPFDVRTLVDAIHAVTPGPLSAPGSPRGRRPAPGGAA